VSGLAGAKHHGPASLQQPCGLLLVAGGAVNTSFFRLVAIDTGAHRDVTFKIEPVALGNFSVTLLASAPRREVHFVAEHHVSRNLVYARPPDLAIVFCERGQLLNLLAISPDFRMALHATGSGGNTHSLARIGIRMTLAALQLQSSCVHLVAESNWLLRGRRRLFGSLC